MDWLTTKVTRIHFIMWLNGAAGAGKSAIARSVIDLCMGYETLVVARFFFFRTDPTRDHLNPVVPTIAYQLIQRLPEISPFIVTKIGSHPFIFHETFETQFRLLILEPLHKLYVDLLLHQTVVFIFDGVDECLGHENQVNLIRTLAKFVKEQTFPLLAIFSSRAENQIKAEFRSRELINTTRHLVLDNNYQPSQDIQLFLEDGFTRIRDTHPFFNPLNHEWPTSPVVDEIVNKSSGQFIYASVVMKFVATARMHPAHQLEIVRGLRPTGNLTPFAQLDVLYSHIFSQVQDIDRAFLILAWCILGNNDSVSLCTIYLGISADDIHTALADLTSVITCDNYTISIQHASLPDFLQDQRRSGKYYMDKPTWSARVMVSTLCCAQLKRRKISLSNTLFTVIN